MVTASKYYICIKETITFDLFSPSSYNGTATLIEKGKLIYLLFEDKNSIFITDIKVSKGYMLEPEVFKANFKQIEETKAFKALYGK